MRPQRPLIVILLFILVSVCGAKVIVSPSDASAKEKAAADFVCDGKDDQVELLASFTTAKKYDFLMDTSPGDRKMVNCYGRHHVEWLPGSYYLSDTLVVPDAADSVIDGKGAYIYYLPDKGDAIVLSGMYRCEYSFGVIETKSAGAAIRLKPAGELYSALSYISAGALIGSDQKGTGLLLDASITNVCVNRFEIKDISGFDVGVHVGAGGVAKEIKHPGHGKCDCNWFWLYFVRRCNTCIWEEGETNGLGVDANEWFVNVDPSIPNAIGIRTAAWYGQWHITMGAWGRVTEPLSDTKVLILEPGAKYNYMVFMPPLDMDIFEGPQHPNKKFLWEDNSGNDTNIIVPRVCPEMKSNTKPEQTT